MRRPYVSDIREREVIVADLHEPLPDWLGAYHPIRLTGVGHRIPTTDLSLQQALLQLLRDHGIAFGGATSGWSPAEIFADLRQRGLVQGDFEEISFAGPGRSIVRRR